MMMMMLKTNDGDNDDNDDKDDDDDDDDKYDDDDDDDDDNEDDDNDDDDDDDDDNNDYNCFTDLGSEAVASVVLLLPKVRQGILQLPSQHAGFPPFLLQSQLKHKKKKNDWLKKKKLCRVQVQHAKSV
jgi:hypothetical protein